MTKSNVKIVRDYIEEVGNHKNYDALFEFVDKNCIVHLQPFVGLGIMSDDTSGHQVIITKVLPNGPAHGHLHMGDELIRVHTDFNTWETFDQLRSGLWGHGIPGTQITLTVRRAGHIITIPLTSARVEGSTYKLADEVDTWRAYVLKTWPDLKSHIELIFGDGDLVTCYCINHGMNMEYHRAAVWNEINIFRLKDGKISEIWGVEDAYEMMRQLGFQISEPEKELVP
jgi:predicted ester cyclase